MNFTISNVSLQTEKKYSQMQSQLQDISDANDQKIQTIADIISLHELGAQTQKKNTILKKQQNTPRQNSIENDKEITDMINKKIKKPKNSQKHCQNQIKIKSKTNFVTSASFKTRNSTKKWNFEETEQFYQALSLYGTDFSIISQFFPGRNRDTIKNKFNYEEKINSKKIDKALNTPVNSLSKQNNLSQINQFLNGKYCKNYEANGDIFEKLNYLNISIDDSKLSQINFEKRFFEIVNEEILSHNHIANKLNFVV